MTAANNRDTGAPGRLAAAIKRTMKGGDLVELLLVTANGLEPLTQWNADQIEDPAEWANECSEFAQDDCEAASTTSNYVVRILRDARAVLTHRLRRVPAGGEGDSLTPATHAAVNTMLVKHCETLMKNFVSVATSAHNPMVKTLEAMTDRVVQLEGQRGSMVDEVARHRLIMEKLRAEVDEAGIDIDDKFLERLMTIGEKMWNYAEMAQDMKKKAGD